VEDNPLQIYTDGSKTKKGVGSGIACGKEVRLGKGARVAWVGRATRAVVQLVLDGPDI